MNFREITKPEHALKVMGLTIDKVNDMFKSFPERCREEKINSFILDTIEDVLNMSAPYDWKETSKRKWRLYWNIIKKDGSSGFGLSLVVCRYDDSGAGVGARRTFGSQEIGIHAAEYFIELYEKEFFDRKKYLHWSEITTIDAAYNSLRLNRIEVIEALRKVPGFTEKDIADKDVDTIVEAINMGEEPDFKDTSKRKCHILWEIKKGSSGFGLSLYGCRYVASLAAVGARRAFNSEPQALHAAKHFQRQYEVEYFGE